MACVTPSSVSGPLLCAWWLGGQRGASTWSAWLASHRPLFLDLFCAHGGWADSEGRAPGVHGLRHTVLCFRTSSVRMVAGRTARGEHLECMACVTPSSVSGPLLCAWWLGGQRGASTWSAWLA